MHLVRRLKQLPNRATLKRFVSNSGKYNTNVSSGSGAVEAAKPLEHIHIPDRIQRSRTDILRALAATVRRDHTAAHYKYHDDPYLIPMSNLNKRAFAIAQESGRKAAMWIKEEHSKLFQHQEAQPHIKEFAPKMVYSEESEVDQHSLEQLIQQAELTDAVFVYKLLQQKNIEISAALKQSLLELVCFFNNEEPLSEELIEERWFKQSTSLRDRNRQTWKDGDLADKLFAEIQPKTAASYAAIIRGMAKYYQAERAYALLQEAIEHQFELDVNTFNAVINVSNFLKETADQRWELCQQLLQQMAQQQLRPNVGTMNALLQTISTFGNFKLARGTTLKVLAELKRLGVTPSLGTYYYVLINFCRERVPVSHVLVDIMQEASGKEFTVQHPKDTYFFTTAMDVCRNHLHDKSLAQQVDALLHTGRNYDLIGDTYKESIYYRHYFALLAQTEPIEEFMRTYDLLVPNIYTPEPGIMEEILKLVELSAAVELVPRFWSDMLIFEHTTRESLLTRLLSIMVAHKPNVVLPPAQREQLPQKLATVAQDIFQKVCDSQGRTKQLSFTGQMIGDILTVLVRAGSYDHAIAVFDYMDKQQHQIPGTPAEPCLLEFIDGCIVHKAPSQALNCVRYAVENQMDGLLLAQRINEGFTLNEVHLSKLKSLVGEGFLRK